MRKAINFILCFILLAAKVSGHEGHDHAAKTVTPSEASFSAENRTEKYELLLRYAHLEPGKEASFTIFLSDEKTNAAIHGANLKITNKDNISQVFKVEEHDSGVYEVISTFKDKGPNVLDININGSLGADLIRISGVESGKETDSEQTSPDWFSYQHILILLGTLLLGLALGYFFRRKAVLLLIFSFYASPLNDLIAHEGHDHNAAKNTNSSGAEFQVPKETQFLFHMLTERVETRDYVPAFTVFGTIVPSSSGYAVLTSPQNAVIRSMNVHVGQSVKEGDVLAVLEQNVDAATSVDWMTRKNEVDAELNAAKKELDRLRSIQDIAAQRDVDEAERRYEIALNNQKLFQSLYSNSASKRITLKAPISGIVQNFTWSIGSNVTGGQELFSISNLKTVYVEAQLFARDLEKFSGTNLELEVEGRTHKSTKLKLLSSGQAFNSSNQAQRVLFELQNDSALFKLGEFVNVRILSKSSSRAISLPNSAITELNGKSMVFIKESAEKYSVRYVERGENNGQFSTIRSGLKEEEKVIVNGSYQMKMIYQNQ